MITGLNLEGGISDAGENAIRVDGVFINSLQKVSVVGRFNDKNQLFATTLRGGVYRDGDFIRYAEVTDSGESLTDNSAPVLELDGTQNLNDAVIYNGEVTLTADSFVGDTASIKSNAGGYSVNLSGDLSGKTFLAGGGSNVLHVSAGVKTLHIFGAESTDKIFVDGGRWVEQDNNGVVYVATSGGKVTLDGWTKFSNLGSWLLEDDRAILYTEATMGGAR